jgi:hypothetical protein
MNRQLLVEKFGFWLVSSNFSLNIGWTISMLLLFHKARPKDPQSNTFYHHFYRQVGRVFGVDGETTN